MSAAPEALVEFVRETADLMERAGAASYERDSTTEVDLVKDAASGLLGLFTALPQEVPWTTAVLLNLSPRVLSAHVYAACHMASNVIDAEVEDVSALLEPRCLSWVHDACERHSAQRWPVLAGLAVEYSASGITRPGLPLDPHTRDMAGAARLPELEAMRDVTELHAGELEARSVRMTELLELMGPRFTEHGHTVRDAIEALSGAERVRAEELYATLPAIMCIGGDAR